MPILYSVIARGKCILAEYAEKNLGGNYGTVTQVLLGKIEENQNETRMTYKLDQHLFHYIVHDTITFLCMADDAARRVIPFQFLEDIQRRFHATYGGAGQTAIAYALNADFAPVIKRQMDYFNSQEGDDIGRVKNKINEVKDVMMQNIDNVLERGEKLELLVERSDNLQQESFKFQRSAKHLRRAQLWSKVKTGFFVSLIVLCFCYFVAATVCGISLNEC
mmetsp:Transcript_5101/g.7049  ORF Transcript_5101/g.7049 Transcript_5101/m.7049 type:complete len:220 (+) Transcript_5101:66-725(+)